MIHTPASISHVLVKLHINVFFYPILKCSPDHTQCPKASQEQEVEQVIYWKVGGAKSQHAIGCMCQRMNVRQKSIKHVVQTALSFQVE